MAIPSTGAYGSPAGVIFSYPVTVKDGTYSIVEGLALSDFDQQMIKATGGKNDGDKAIAVTALSKSIKDLT